MSTVKQRLNNVGIQLPDILLPKEEIDYKKWAVIACDQFTSEPDYWQKVGRYVGSDYSTLHLIYPEVYLNKPDMDERIENINRNMDQYMKAGVFRDLPSSFVLVKRELPSGGMRTGLVLALDLERYSYEKGAKTLIRATEGTILDRLPPRIRIRRNAPIELPHIMVLIDDKEDLVFSKLREREEDLPRLYDFELMEGGGRVEGFQVQDDATLSGVAEAFENLYSRAERTEAETADSSEDGSPLLFAMGDGNHSFATAKAIWEETKKETGNMEHPARWAIVELVNIYDPGLDFEPIHRLALGLDITVLKDFIDKFKAREHAGSRPTPRYEPAPDFPSALKRVSGGEEHRIAVISKDECGVLVFPQPEVNLGVASLDGFLEKLGDTVDFTVDYIHGAETTRELASVTEIAEPRTGFILPDFSKDQLFPTVVGDGALPRKTFSMGEAREKRYYMEARRIQ